MITSTMMMMMMINNNNNNNNVITNALATVTTKTIVSINSRRPMVPVVSMVGMQFRLQTTQEEILQQPRTGKWRLPLPW